MVLNYIWISFFLIAFVVALFKLIFMGDVTVFPAMFNKTLEMAKVGFEISLGLTGAMTLWLGIMKIGEKGGTVQIFYRLTGPLLRRLFPGLPANSDAYGPMIMNVSVPEVWNFSSMVTRSFRPSTMSLMTIPAV